MSLSEVTQQLVAPIGWDLRELEQHVQRAIDEDLAYGLDVTTLATVSANQRVRAQFAARQPGVACGIGLVAAVLDLVVEPGSWRAVETVGDGHRLEQGDVVCGVEAPALGLLTAERTALNYLGHLSGVATLTATWVDAVAGTGAVVRDTRKTLPGLRVLEKYAVRCGGGANHRMGLGDAALVKDNHVAAAGSVTAAVSAVRAYDPDIPLEVECDTVEQVLEAIDAGAQLILLDNMPPEQLAQSVEAGRARGTSVRFEASGGLTLETVRVAAATGVDFLAVGALTHSARVLDLGLDVVEVLDRVGQ